MEASSFTIEFPEHVAEDRIEYCLFQLRDRGAAVELVASGRYLVSCRKPTEVARVGAFLFHSQVASYTHVVAASGAAELRAGAYRPAT